LYESRTVPRIDSHGDIETMLHGDQTHQPIVVGDRVALVFRAIDDPASPISVIIHSPNGHKILERVLRELPTGLPQSAPAVEFVPSSKGTYQIEVSELRGKQRGTATLKVG
jgi:hypothetical protein